MSLTREDLQALRSEFVTKDDLRTELERFATKEDLRRELARYATRDELKAELARFATEELGAFREETAQAFADLRRYMEILIEDQTSKMRIMFDGLASRIEALDRRVSGRLDGHDTGIDGLEGRVTLLEARRPKQP